MATERSDNCEVFDLVKQYYYVKLLRREIETELRNSEIRRSGIIYITAINVFEGGLMHLTDSRDQTFGQRLAFPQFGAEILP
jgi:hypothetical protein